jgi:glycosyltransferase involved in cell wall biosynthesis
VSRLLVLLPAVPWPLDAGAKIRNHGLLSLLGAEHDVDAIAFGEGALPDVVRRSALVPVPVHRPVFTRVMDLAQTSLPDMVHRLWSPAFAQQVDCFLKDGDYDAVQAEGIEMARYLSAVPPDRRVYDAHNAEFLLQRRFSESTGSRHRRLYSRLQWRRLERFERGLVRGSRLTLAVSQHDANQLLALAGPEANVRVLPNAIDATAYPFVDPQPAAPPNLLFLGKLDFRPNEEALRWFVQDVLQPLKCARLFAVGAAPPKWLVAAGQHNDRVAVTGYVDDERPYLARCAALVLPLKTAAGTRLKALVAMATGLPIVSTSVGMEGLDVEPGQHFLLAESPSEWVASLKRILDDVQLRQHLARNGRTLIERRYDWSALRADVLSAYGSILNA